MKFYPTALNDAYLIELEKFADQRGFFARTFCKDEFAAEGIHHQIVQTNLSQNKFRHTLRGMHYQAPPHREAKLVHCIRGAIYDVIIDVRPDSSTYKQWIGKELSHANGRMLYVPEGFAHGFLTLQDDTEILYQVSEYYAPDAEEGIRHDDPAFNIDWPAVAEIVSEKDQKWPAFNE